MRESRREYSLLSKKKSHLPSSIFRHSPAGLLADELAIFTIKVAPVLHKEFFVLTLRDLDDGLAARQGRRRDGGTATLVMAALQMFTGIALGTGCTLRCCWGNEPAAASLRSASAAAGLNDLELGVGGADASRAGRLSWP
jgi:hypothetical protein